MMPTAETLPEAMPAETETPRLPREACSGIIGQIYQQIDALHLACEHARRQLQAFDEDIVGGEEAAATAESLAAVATRLAAWLRAGCHPRIPHRGDAVAVAHDGAYLRVVKTGRTSVKFVRVPAKPLSDLRGIVTDTTIGPYLEEDGEVVAARIRLAGREEAIAFYDAVTGERLA